MRYFFGSRGPTLVKPPSRMLLVESGARQILDNGIAKLRTIYGNNTQFDLLTCLPGLPPGLDPGQTRVFRVTDCRSRADRRRLLSELRSQHYRLLGIVCSAEPVMTPWKFVVSLALPAKVLVFNENADFFWLDWNHRQAIRQFVFYRAGLMDDSAVRKLARLAAFPFVLAFLLLFAGWVHVRRGLRLAFGK